MKKNIIAEINKIVLNKFERDNKREECLSVLEDTDLNTEDSEVVQLIAKKLNDKIIYKKKSFFHTMREFQPREQNINYINISLDDFSEEKLKEILDSIKDYKY